MAVELPLYKPPGPSIRFPKTHTAQHAMPRFDSFHGNGSFAHRPTKHDTWANYGIVSTNSDFQNKFHKVEKQVDPLLRCVQTIRKSPEMYEDDWHFQVHFLDGRTSRWFPWYTVKVFCKQQLKKVPRVANAVRIASPLNQHFV